MFFKASAEFVLAVGCKRVEIREKNIVNKKICLLLIDYRNAPWAAFIREYVVY